MSEEERDMGHNFHKNKTKDWFNIKAKKEVSEKAGDMDINFFKNGTKAKLIARSLGARSLRAGSLRARSPTTTASPASLASPN